MKSTFFLVLAAFLLVATCEVIPFDNAAVEKIFQSKKSALFIFASENEASTSALAAFAALDEAGTEVVLTVSKANDGHGLYERLAEYLGVDPSSTPSILYLGEQQDKYLFNGEATKDSLNAFLEKIKAGEVEQYLKSAPVPETNDEPVKIGVGKNFKELVLDNEKEVLVKFYAPWCGHCKTLAPHYDEAAKKLLVNPNILFVKVDSTLNEVAGVDIQGFPTVKFFAKDKSQAPIDFTGGRNVEGIISWLKEHTEYEWVEPAGAAQESSEEL